MTQLLAATALLRIGGSLVAPIGHRAFRHPLVAGPVAAVIALLRIAHGLIARPPRGARSAMLPDPAFRAPHR